MGQECSCNCGEEKSDSIIVVQWSFHGVIHLIVSPSIKGKEIYLSAVNV